MFLTERSWLGFCRKLRCFRDAQGKMNEPVDAFAHPFWDTIRDTVSNKAIGMRRQGFFGAAMLPMSELEYTGIMEKLKALDKRFAVRR
jgi:fructose 1,6-bisphosphate aldolase/phosphatase